MPSKQTKKVQEPDLRFLLDLTNALSIETDLNALLVRLLETIFTIDGPDCGGVYLVDDNTGALDLAVHRGLPEDFIEHVAHFDADSPQVSLVTKGETVFRHWSELFEIHEGESAEHANLKAVAIIPILHQGSVIAVLNIASHDCDEYNDTTRTMFQAVAAQVGIHIVRAKTEAKLRESEEKFRLAFETSPDIVAITGMDGKIVLSNEGFSNLTGYSSEELLGMNALELGLWADPEIRKKLIDALKRDGFVKDMEMVYQNKNGTRRRTSLTSKLFTLNGEPHILTVARDIEDAKRAEEALRESEEKYRSLVEQASEGIFIVNEEGTYIEANPAGCEMLGYSRDELLEKSISDLITEEDLEVSANQFANLVSGSPIQAERRMIRKDGEIILVEINATKLTDDRLMAIARDITERKKAEEALRFTQFAVDHASEGAFWLTPDGNFFYVNDAACDQLGYTRDELLTLSVLDISPTRTPQNWPGRWAEIKERSPVTFESQHRCKNGEIFPVEVTTNYITYEGDEYCCAFARDISDRKKAEEAISESEERFRTFFHTSPDAITITKMDYTLVDVNDRFLAETGYTREELIGKSTVDLNLMPDDELRLKHRESLATRGFTDNLEAQFRMKDGTMKTGLVSARLINLQGEPHVLAVVRNIEDRKKAQEALKESEERWRSLAEKSPDHIITMDKDLKVQFVNYSVPGLTIEDLTGKPLYEFVPGRQDEIREILETVLRTGEPARYETTYIPPSGVPIYFESHVTPRMMDDEVVGLTLSARDITDRKLAEQNVRQQARIINQTHDSVIATDMDGIVTFWNEGSTRLFGFEEDEALGNNVALIYPEEEHEFLIKNIIEPLQEKGQHETETRCRKKSGEDVYIMLSISLLRDETGEVNGMIGFSMDITDRKRAEEEIKRTNEELMAALKVKTEFLSMVSHELRAPLVPILGYADLLHDGQLGDLPQEALAPVSAIKERAEDLITLIEDLLILSRMERDKLSLKLEPVEVHQHIHETIADYVANDYGKPINIECTGDPISVFADHTRFHQVLRNLIDNAIKYSDDSVEIRLCTSSEDNMGLICVSDNGIGISPDQLPRIFERFYQVEEIDTRAHEGTGLGLSITKELLELMDGSITVESEPGKGSKFCIVLPLA